MTSSGIFLSIHIVVAVALLFVEGVPLLKAIAAYIVLEGFVFYFYGKRRENKTIKTNSDGKTGNT